jgi:hypothetical protein
MTKFLSMPWLTLHFKEKIFFLVLAIHKERKVTSLMLGKKYLNSKKDSDFLDKKLTQLINIYSWPILIFSLNQKFSIGINRSNKHES